MLQHETAPFLMALSVIREWKLDKPTLAAKMDMPLRTFMNKLSRSQKTCQFSKQEQERLIEVLKELGTDLEMACGLSFKLIRYLQQVVESRENHHKTRKH